MGKLVSTIFVTLDGVYQAPGGPEEDTRDGFEHGGWSFPFGDDDFGRFITEVFDRPGAFLLGRRTYDIFASFWPKMTDPADRIASQLNALPKYVPSSTLSDPQGLHHRDQRRSGQGGHRPQGAHRRRAPGARQRRPRPVPAGARPRRHPPPADVPGGARLRPPLLRRGRTADQVPSHAADASPPRASPSSRTTWRGARTTARTRNRGTPDRARCGGRVWSRAPTLTRGKLIRRDGKISVVVIDMSLSTRVIMRS